MLAVDVSTSQLVIDVGYGIQDRTELLKLPQQGGAHYYGRMLGIEFIYTKV